MPALHGARKGIEDTLQDVREAQEAIGEMSHTDVPAITVDGILHELQEVEERLVDLQDDMAARDEPAGKDTR